MSFTCTQYESSWKDNDVTKEKEKKAQYHNTSKEGARSADLIALMRLCTTQYHHCKYANLI